MPSSPEIEAYSAEADRFIAELDEEYYLHYAGLKESFELAPIYERHAELTRVEYTIESAPGNLADRIMESFGARSWLRRKNRKALRRLRAILEEDRLRGKRPTLAGG